MIRLILMLLLAISFTSCAIVIDYCDVYSPYDPYYCDECAPGYVFDPYTGFCVAANMSVGP